jgi:hypothetical protein
MLARCDRRDAGSRQVWAERLIGLPGNIVCRAAIAVVAGWKSSARSRAFRRAVSAADVLNRSATEYSWHPLLTGAFQPATADLPRINTLPEGLVLDRFCVHDADFPGPPPNERITQVSQSLVAALKDASGRSPTFTRRFQDQQPAKPKAINHLPTRVNIDNSTADTFTIVAIFAYDRLVCSITSPAPFELGLCQPVQNRHAPGPGGGCVLRHRPQGEGHR